MHLVLAPENIDALRRHHFYYEAAGLVAQAATTSIRVEDYVQYPLAEIDPRNNLNIFVPLNAVFPFVIPTELIKDCQDDGRRIDAFFGPLGTITVSAAVAL